MKYIQKQSSPVDFERYKRKRNASYKDLSEPKNSEVKKVLRKSLLEEQGYICCYCGKRIEIEGSTIEHLKCRINYPQLQLDYQNLMCSCDGGRSKRSKNLPYPAHCDASKGGQELLISPFDLECESLFKFDEEGHIYGMDERAEKAIDVLNLDNPELDHCRKSAIRSLQYIDCGCSDYDWGKEIERINEISEDKHYVAFVYVIKSYIENYIMNF